jgi:hypothetical protein
MHRRCAHLIMAHPSSSSSLILPHLAITTMCMRLASLHHFWTSRGGATTRTCHTRIHVLATREIHTPTPHHTACHLHADKKYTRPFYSHTHSHVHAKNWSSVMHGIQMKILFPSPPAHHHTYKPNRCFCWLGASLVSLHQP